ncbi:MAG: methyl coenzyme M reductase system, component A2 [Nitrososphaerales archaeon]
MDFPTKENILIEIRNVEKSFDGNKVLRGISFDIKEGERLALYGKSGAGKSVLIHMIRGMKDYAPDGGRVVYHVSICPSCKWMDVPSKEGSECLVCHKSNLEHAEIDFWNSDEKIQGELKSRIAIMFQRTFGIYGHFTAIENILEALQRVKMISGDERIEEAKRLVKAVKLTHRMLHPADLLSGGEKQRLVLARQLAIRPIIFLADEPTGTLDAISMAMVKELLIKEVKDKCITLIITSHIPQTFPNLVEKVLWLDKGELVKEFSTPEFMREITSELKVPIPRPIVRKEEAIKVVNLKKYFLSIDRGLVKAVDDVSFSVYQEEIFGIIGLSGAGKTTLSRIIAGITEPSSGKLYIKIAGRIVDMTQWSPDRALALSYIGLLHQEYALYPYSTVLENLTSSIGLELPMQLAEMKAIYTLRALGISEKEARELLNRYPDQLSEGQRHRVALAQVLIREPEAVILDEPSGTMDRSSKIDAALSIKKSRDELKQTFIIITHDIEFAELTCDRVAVMKDGRIINIETPSKAIDVFLRAYS